MFVPALINWSTLVEDVSEGAFRLYVELADAMPPAEHILAEHILYGLDERITEHYVTIERLEAGDHVEPEPFTEHTRVYDVVGNWFALYRLASDVRSAKGGFSCSC